MSAELQETPKQLNPNRIRDHLANECTYLPWMRSGVALMGFGVLIVRLRILGVIYYVFTVPLELLNAVVIE